MMRAMQDAEVQLAEASSHDLSSIEVAPSSGPMRWRLVTRIAFRFCFVYFSLYSVFTQIFGGLLLIESFPDLSTKWPMGRIVTWTSGHIFHHPNPSFADTGSGDRAWDWVLLFCMLVICVAATTVWSLLDRKRSNYVSLAKWFRLFLRFVLASQMLSYGMAKVIPMQMPFPSLARLVEPFGNFSPMGSLWYSVGSSPAYEIFVGSAEVLAGILLVVPRTAVLGAGVCLLDSIYIFTLNMSYDVPVKTFSFHMALMSMYLLAPELSRFFRFFFTDRTVGPSTQPRLFSTRRKNRVALAVQVLLGAWILCANLFGEVDGWKKYGGGVPKSPLYGIWNIEQLTINGQPHPLLIGDKDQYRRVIFDRPESMTMQKMDETFDRLGAKFDTKNGSVTLTKAADKSWHAELHYQRAGKDELALDGSLNGHPVRMQLKLMDRNQFLLVNRGFHWVNEVPFNR